VFVVSAGLAVTLVECGTSAPFTRDPSTVVMQVSPPHDSTPPGRAETDLERTVRVQLVDAFSEEPSLKGRDLRLSVDAGEVTVTGVVRSDAEREKINEVAMNVPGVRSVANALRVAP